MAQTETTPKKVLYIDMDGVIVDFDLFSLMTPMPGAIEAVTELATLFDTYVLSTVPWHNISGASQKIQWIQNHFGAEEGSPLWKRIILSHHKHLNRGDFLIDDRPDRNGAGQFAEANVAGELLHFGGERFPGWDAVLEYLRGRA